ncbi:MAG TPA: glycosyltransferase [Pirellulales bacterium]|nr:glycosyltransferase [Pirellulales bacterium]
MKVLLADFDLFATTGGGQTFYRSVIEANPAIQFFYLSVSEPSNAVRPANARPIPFRERYALGAWDGYCDVAPPRWLLPAFVRANNVAHSAIGHEFDVVDLPDYEQFGTFLRPALAHHGVRHGRIALSLHGRISTSIGLNWGTEGPPPREIEAMEDLQFQSVDLRYGLSHSYLDEWKSKYDIDSHYLSPWRFLKTSSPTRTEPSGEPPNLQLIGRTEKRKGPDLFIDLAVWLPRDSYHKAFIVGPQDWDARGVGSNDHLRAMMKNRGCADAVALLPSANRYDLERLFASRALTCLPSRYDTFNLVAIESLLAGCPAAVGSGAGVCRFLEESLPDVPFIKIEIDDWRACLPRIQEVLGDYDAYRDRLVDRVQAASRVALGPELPEIYRSQPVVVRSVRAEADEWYRRLMHCQVEAAGNPVAHDWKTAAKRLVKSRTTPEFRRRLRSLHPRRAAAAAKSALKQRLRGTLLHGPLATGHSLTQAESFLASYRHIHHSSERTDADLHAKARCYGELISRFRADRSRLWRELARIESLRDDPLAAATYRLRAMRLAGTDRFHDLPDVTSTLDQHGYHREAVVADAMFGEHQDREDRCGRLLHAALENGRQIPEFDYERIDDRRPGERRVRVSIIVSLYDAADKLPVFLRALGLQTLLRAGEGEIVLIDSGSPGDEYAVFRRMADDLKIPTVYARSAARESIQSAWNRGITLARGQYLSFLGVDEGIVPATLEILARELDADPTLDWVQANSLVTNVNERGQWLSDIMTYDRQGYRQSLVYLETCYLSWVGALYRKNIHDRCGFYDPSFRAAGDTEFKNRVLPFIKTKAIPQTLGVFWNYPSGQTTCSPRAEIEDLRAWYLHRTLAGVRYAFGERDPAEAEELLYATLRYRKSYCQHWSTDAEYGHNIAMFLHEKQPQGSEKLLLGGLANLLATYRSLDYLPNVTAASLAWSLSRAFYVAQRAARQHYELSGERVRPAYQVFNDNRHEQHTQLWGKAA